LPIETEFRTNGVILWHSGVITGQEVIETNDAIYKHQYEGRLLFQLADLSDVEEFNVSSNDMKHIADMDRLYKEAIHNIQYCCVVAPSDALYARSRQWNIQAQEDDFHANVVRSMDKAIAWFKSKGITVSI